MKLRLHPVLLPFFLFLIITGNISVYAIFFISLLIHEAGHLVAAYLTGMRCTVLYHHAIWRGDLFLLNRHVASKNDRIFVALGGPLRNSGSLFNGYMDSVSRGRPGHTGSSSISCHSIYFLFFLLTVDRQSAHCLRQKDQFIVLGAIFLLHSILFISVGIILLSSGLPKTIPYILLALFLLIQNISVFRFRKYEKAFAEIKLNRLT